MGATAHRARIEPLSAARYRIQLDASAELKGKLDRARELLSHVKGSGDLALVLERALDALLERLEARRFGRRRREQPGSKPESAADVPGAGSRGTRESAPRAGKREHISNATRRAVVERDGLRCTFVGDDGQRCEAAAFLQLHHERAWALGGGSAVDNLRLLCAPHNRFCAERDFGRAHVERAIEKSAKLRHRRS
jgi:hypothetical protein